MSFDKHMGKEHRKPYRGGKAIDKTCRNHGGCPTCRANRLHSNTKLNEEYRHACRKSFEVNRDKFTYERDGQKWNSGDDMFDWWISERRGRYVVWGGKCQLPLFADDDNNIV